MPTGQPSAAQLWQGDVSFFSIDTDLIQAAGYNFDAGALHQLPKQLPASMHLQLTEVVAEEIVRHRMEPVHQAIQQFTGATDKLKRLAEAALGPIEQSFQELDAATAAAERFRGQVHAYAGRCRGGVLPISGPMLASDLFKLYFADAAPFGKRLDKKSEFPDATSLLLLEQFALENKTKGIVASGDAGWTAYAEASANLYAVRSLDELAALFAATSDHAKALKAKILGAVNEAGSALRAQLTEALRRHVAEAEWDASELHASSGRIEAEVYDAELAEYSFEERDIGVWPAEGDPATWVVELTALVKATVHVSVAFYIWDSVDREELSFGGESFSFPAEVEVEAFLTCSDVQLEAEPDAWHIDIDIANGSYSLEDFEVEQDLGDDGR
ncbi:MAG: PIN domain-containing protein [Burkholderiales bacterium]|nr:PIN domain-containing protein [Burkholderiales bacterium]